MNAYVQQGVKNWLNRETMMEGFHKAGFWTAHVEELKPDDIGKHIYYGNVGFIRRLVYNLGYKERWIGHVPEDLYPLAGREIIIRPISEVLRSRVKKFIKPTPDKNKSFDGFVYTGDQMEQLIVVNYFMKGDEPIIVSDVVNFVSEWRCYICNGEILDGKHYKGDFRKAPDYSVADKAIELWKDAPVAWSCDIGVTDEGKTLIVECNDVMSLGMYGLAPHKAALMLEKRWEQIHKLKSL